MDINDILIHLGENRKNYFNAVSPPIIQTSNFVFDTIEEFQNLIQDELNNHIYSRGNNPTVEILRKKVAALEKAEDALITGSGSAAVAIAVMSNVKCGDHAIIIDNPYSWTHKLFTKLMSKFGVEYTFVDGREVSNIRAAIKDNTTLLFLESPNSVTFEMQDLAACAELAKENNITTIIDNSYSSPLFQNPISHGIDIVVHSGTKYMNGHSDVVCGVICSNKEMILKMFKNEFMTIGTIISPNDASLIIRGLRTLPTRLNRIVKTTNQVIKYLEDHPKVKQVIYPFSKSNPQYSIAEKQMSSGTGLFSIILNVNSKSDVKVFVGALEKFLIAVSWGGHESLIMPFICFHDIPNQPDHHIDWRLVRFSIGLEDPEYLINDIRQAFLKID